MFARVTAPLFLLGALAASAAAAQSAVIDEGSFRLTINGTAVGTESFSIRQNGTGDAATMIAQGRVVLDSGEQTRGVLQVEGPALTPSAYQIEVTGSETQNIRGQAAGNRFRATIVSDAGETMREYIAGEGAVILDNGVAHHYFFLAQMLERGDRIPIIIPRQSRQVAATVTSAGSESINVAGTSVSARRLLVQPTGLPQRTVWVDDDNRVLRLEIPDEGYIAERTAVP